MKLQRLVNSTPMAVMEMLLTVTHLHTHVKEETIKSILRLKTFHSPAADLWAHTKGDQRTADRMICNYDFDKKFQTSLPSRVDFALDVALLSLLENSQQYFRPMLTRF